MSIEQIIIYLLGGLLLIAMTIFFGALVAVIAFISDPQADRLIRKLDRYN